MLKTSELSISDDPNENNNLYDPDDTAIMSEVEDLKNLILESVPSMVPFPDQGKCSKSDTLYVIGCCA